MSDGIGLAEALLGLPGFRVLEVAETADEVVITIETTAVQAAVSVCGARPRRRIGCRSTSAIWPASGGRRGWCGEAAVALPRAAVPGKDVDRDLRALSTPRWC